MRDFISVNLTNEFFYAGALGRIQRFMAVLWAGSALTWLVLGGWRPALGIVVGCGVSYINFVWLKRVVTAVADRVANTGYAESGRGIIARFVLRYTLMGLLAYVILTLSPASLVAFIAGLFLPVAAIACEATCQAYMALVKGA